MKRIPSLYIATLSSLFLLQAGSVHAEDWGDWSLETELIIESQELEDIPLESDIDPIAQQAPEADSAQWNDSPSPTDNPDDFEDSPLSAREQAIFNELDNSDLSDYEHSDSAQDWEEEQPLLMQLEKLEQLHEAEELIGEMIDSEEAIITNSGVIIFSSAGDSDDEMPEAYGLDGEMETEGSDDLYDDDHPLDGDSIEGYEGNDALLEALPLEELGDLPLNDSDMADGMNEVLVEEIEFELPENVEDAIELIESLEEIPGGEEILDALSNGEPLDEIMEELPFDGEISDSFPMDDDLPFEDEMDDDFDDDLADEVYE